MATNPTNIDRLRIATPCPISWEQMTGDNRVRFCDHCHLNVYNITELSRSETETLIASTEGRLCARLFRRADGTILTKDCPVGLRALRIRVSKRAAAVFAAIASISAVAFGQQSSTKNEKTACAPQTRITRTTANPYGDSVVSGTVLDQSGAVVPRVKVTLINQDSKETKTVSANDSGRFEFASLPPGSYTIKIEARTFTTLNVINVVVEKDRSIDLDTIVEPKGEHLIGIVGISDLIDTPAGTTIFNEKMIQSLPH